MNSTQPHPMPVATVRDDQSLSSLNGLQRAINVLHIICSLPLGGAENQVVTLASALSRGRYKIHVCCLRGEGVQANILQSRGIQVIALNMRLLYWPIAVYKLYRLIKQLNPQIVHTHLYDAGVWGVPTSRLAGVPVIITTEHSRAFPPRRHLLLEPLVNHFADKRIAVSEDIHQFVARNKAVPPKKIVTIPTAVDPEKFREVNPRDEFRTQLGVNDASPLIGTVARLVQPKRLDYLLEAARMVCDAVPQARFLIIGDGPLREKLEAQASQLGLTSENLRFLGSRQDIPDLLSALDIFVLSSEREGLPVALLEAMAASKPVVVPSVGGIPQVVEDRQNGLLVPPHDPASLGRAIIMLLRDCSLREALAREAYRTVETRFSVDIVRKQIVALYDELLATKGNNHAS